MTESTNYLIGHYYALLLGNQLGSPMPKKARDVIIRLQSLRKRVELHENPYNIDLEGLKMVRAIFEQAEKAVKVDHDHEQGEKLLEKGIEELLSWGALNNVWVGTSTYITTKMEADNGYKIGK